MWNPHGVVAKVPGSDIVLSEFELSSHYYVHIWENHYASSSFG